MSEGYTLVIAGSRSITDKELVFFQINQFVEDPYTPFISKVISGGAIGIDTFAKEWAEAYKKEFKEYKPKYHAFTNKKLAPLMRNMHMAIDGDFGLIIWDGKSTGSMHMKECLISLDKNVKVITHGS